jgi:hypothetical protein
MEKEVELRKKVNGSACTLYPKTSAENVKYSSDQSVADILSGILADIKLIKENLGITEEVYAKDSSGNVLDDGSGTNIVLLSKATGLSN